MGTTWKKMGIWFVLCMLTTPAYAWIAIAYSKDSGHSDVVFDASNPGDAEKEALANCSEHALQCVLVGKANQGPGALVVAKGATSMGRSFNHDAEIAKKDALLACHQNKKHDGCRVVSASWESGGEWTATAIGEGASFTMAAMASKEDSEREAIAGCESRATKHGSCKIAMPAVIGPAWVAGAESQSSLGIGRNATAAAAAEVAMSRCKEMSGKGETCKDAWQDYSKGPEPASPAFNALLASIEHTKKSQGKTSSSRQEVYRDTCSNASCIRRYQDGHSERYTACINPASLLPMNDPQKLGGCGGMDTAGNLFGMKH